MKKQTVKVIGHYRKGVATVRAAVDQHGTVYLNNKQYDRAREKCCYGGNDYLQTVDKDLSIRVVD